MNKRITTVIALAMTIAVLAAAPAQACACGSPAQARLLGASLQMSPNPDTVSVGEPVTFTITKTNLLPYDFDWYVRDFLPAGAQFVSATSSQGDCALKGRAELGIPYNPTNGYDSDVVHCDLGTIPSGGSATMDVTVAPTAPGEMTSYAADNGQSLAHAIVVVA